MGTQTGPVVVVIGILVALLAAGLVLLVASVTSSGDSQGSPWRSFRAGWAARGTRDEAARAAEAEPVDLKLAEFLAVTADQGDAYLHVEELGDSLHRARDKALAALPGARRS